MRCYAFVTAICGLPRRHAVVALCLLAAFPPLAPHVAVAQIPPADPGAASDSSDEPTSPRPPAKVEVEPAARDDEIKRRLVDILEATNWYRDVAVSVTEGVVFLDGVAIEESGKEFARELAQSTEGVVAVVNRMEIATPSVWDFEPARAETDRMLRGAIRSLPLIVIGLAVLVSAWLGARVAGLVLRRLLGRKVRSRLLLEVAARAGGILVLLIGLYIVLRVSGLTRLAVTLVGGTGLVGLILGIAFRDITENFLASLFLSLQQPFREGDLVEVAGATGFVQRLTSRTTVLLTLDGNQLQVPNATVFKSTIRNFTSNPNRREDFTVGVGYNDPIPHAQEVALKVLAAHPAVLKEPEPWVLVDELGSAAVKLRIYFWLDGSRHSWLKVRSSVIRLIKRAYQDAGISLPDEAREVVFPDGVPVRMIEDTRDGDVRASRRPAAETDEVATRAEGDLETDARQIKDQARHAWSPEQGENLLTGSKDEADAKRPG